MTAEERSTRSRILIADDQDDIRAALAMVLLAEGYETVGAASPAETLLLLGRGHWDALLLDLNFCTDTTSGDEGMALLARLTKIDPALPVIVLTGWGTIDLALRAMRLGAADFIEKPWENTRLLSILRNQLALFSARGTVTELLGKPQTGKILYQSRAMGSVMTKLAKIAATDVMVLISGESGTGKGALAKAIVTASRRADAAFIQTDMGAIPEGLIESTLFGHARGAFTDARSSRPGQFEIAHRGTLFLDEIGNASASVQSRLLTVLESGQVTRVGEDRPRAVDVRLIAATNANLEARIAAGGFRNDLYFRLNTVEIVLPPLRDRPEDIPLLAKHFLIAQARRHNREVSDFTPEASAALAAYPWPGNVRELAHVVERAVLFTENGLVRPADLQLPVPASPQFEKMTLDQAERYLIQHALAAADGDAEAAARRLGLSRSAFYRRLTRLKD